jgi:hypothetical protein
MTLRALVLGAALALLPAAAPAQDVVHGADSLFVSPTVKLAWVVRRGATEADTLVVVRIADAAYRLVRVDGIDPFTKQHKVFIAARPLDRETDVAIPRAQFADHPSTEFRFFASAEDAAADKAKLTVFYLGVPDTTPEFAGQREAEAYLARMLGQK